MRAIKAFVIARVVVIFEFLTENRMVFPLLYTRTQYRIVIVRESVAEWSQRRRKNSIDQRRRTKTNG